MKRFCIMVMMCLVLAACTSAPTQQNQGSTKPIEGTYLFSGYNTSAYIELTKSDAGYHMVYSDALVDAAGKLKVRAFGAEVALVDNKFKFDSDETRFGNATEIHGELELTGASLSVLQADVDIIMDPFIRTDRTTVYAKSAFSREDIKMEKFDGLLSRKIYFAELDTILGQPTETHTFIAYGSDTAPEEYQEFGAYRTYGDIQFMFFIGGRTMESGWIMKISSQSKYISLARGLVVGDSLEKVLTSFPNEHHEFSTDSYYETAQLLYGDYTHMQTGGVIVYTESKPAEVFYTNEGWGLQFLIDESGLVSEVNVVGEG